MNLDRLGRPNPQVGRLLLYTKRVEMYFSPDQLAELNKMARRKRMTRPELIRIYIEWGLEMHSKDRR